MNPNPTATSAAPSNSGLSVVLAILLMFLATGCPQQDPSVSQDPTISQGRFEQHMQRAMQFQANRKYQASIIELKNALSLRNADGEARRLLGEAYLRLGKGDIAENELRKAQQAGISRKLL